MNLCDKRIFSHLLFYFCFMAVCGGMLIPVWAVIVIVLGGVLLIGFIVLIIVKIILFAQVRPRAISLVLMHD